MREPDREAFETLDALERPGARFEVLQYPALRGSADLAVAEKIFLLNQARIRLKRVRVTLDQHLAFVERRGHGFDRAGTLGVDPQPQRAGHRQLEPPGVAAREAVVQNHHGNVAFQSRRQNRRLARTSNY